jgi:hypothetical protein
MEKYGGSATDTDATFIITESRCIDDFARFQVAYRERKVRAHHHFAGTGGFAEEA